MLLLATVLVTLFEKLVETVVLNFSPDVFLSLCGDLCMENLVFSAALLRPERRCTLQLALHLVFESVLDSLLILSISKI